MTPLCFVDTETTGVHRDRRVWEVAMIRRDEFGQRETSFMIRTDLAHADPYGLKVGRFYERHPQGLAISRATRRSNQPTPSQPPPLNGYDAALKVAEWTYGAHIVGAVPNFDTETLAGLLYRHQLTPAWHYRLIDVEALAVGFLAGRGLAVRSLLTTRGITGPDADSALRALKGAIDPVRGRPADLAAIVGVDAVRAFAVLADAIATAYGDPISPPWKSDELSRACGVEPPSEADRHTALGDARWVMRWYDAITSGGAS